MEKNRNINRIITVISILVMISCSHKKHEVDRLDLSDTTLFDNAILGLTNNKKVRSLVLHIGSKVCQFCSASQSYLTSLDSSKKIPDYIKVINLDISLEDRKNIEIGKIFAFFGGPVIIKITRNEDDKYLKVIGIKRGLSNIINREELEKFIASDNDIKSDTLKIISARLNKYVEFLHKNLKIENSNATDSSLVSLFLSGNEKKFLEKYQSSSNLKKILFMDEYNSLMKPLTEDDIFSKNIQGPSTVIASNHIDTTFLYKNITSKKLNVDSSYSLNNNLVVLTDKRFVSPGETLSLKISGKLFTQISQVNIITNKKPFTIKILNK